MGPTFFKANFRRRLTMLLRMSAGKDMHMCVPVYGCQSTISPCTVCFRPYHPARPSLFSED